MEGDASFGGAGEQDSQDPMTFDGTAEINGPGLLSIEDSGPAVTNNGTLTVAAGRSGPGQRLLREPRCVPQQRDRDHDRAR